MARSVYERLGRSTVSGVRSVEHTHRVVGNETLPFIAALEYADAGYNSELWRQIAEANDITDLDEVTPGQVLIIPTPQASET